MSIDSYASAAASRISKTDPPTEPFVVLGTNQTGDTMYGDFLPQLRGRQGMRVMREMTSNDATIGSILYAIEMLLREMTWEPEPDSETPKDEDAAVLLGECMEDMDHTWPDFVAQDLSFLPFGFSLFEVCYGRRLFGEGSMFNDGKIRWREFSPRPQESIIRWERDDEGRLAGASQSTPKGPVLIPRDKLLLTRTDSTTPEGRSILRTAYPAWYRKKYLEEQLTIGIQRDLAGMPIAWIPAENLAAKDAVYEAWRQIVTRSKKDDLWGWLLPLERDDQGNKLYEFDIVRGGNTDIAGGIAAIRMFAQDIATAVLAGFVGLGRDAVGSRALAEPMQEIFQTTLEAWADVVQACINKDAVDPLLKLNGAGRASLVHGPIKDTNLDDLGRLITASANAGQDWSDDGAVNRVRQLAGFEPIPEGEGQPPREQRREPPPVEGQG